MVKKKKRRKESRFYTATADKVLFAVVGIIIIVATAVRLLNGKGEEDKILRINFITHQCRFSTFVKKKKIPNTKQ